jgi:hypothetical protein
VEDGAPAAAALRGYMHGLLLHRSATQPLKSLAESSQRLIRSQAGGQSELEQIEEQLATAGWVTTQPLLEPLRQRSALQIVKGLLPFKK